MLVKAPQPAGGRALALSFMLKWAELEYSVWLLSLGHWSEPSWHQGQFSWKTVFHWLGVEVGGWLGGRLVSGWFNLLTFRVCILWESSASAGLTGGGAQMVIPALGNSCKHRWSFVHSSTPHLLLCGLGRGQWCWGPLLWENIFFVVVIFNLLYLLAVLQGIQDLSSLARDEPSSPALEMWSLNLGHQGRPSGGIY